MYLCGHETYIGLIMDRELLKRIIVRNQQFVAGIPLVRRHVSFEANGNYVFVGVRQAGKSYLLYQRIQELLSQGHDLEEMVYLNFDDERIAGMKADELDLIVQAHETLSDRRPIFFLDELQNIPRWENFARRLANEKYRVYITGSNARMLSRDIATTLGGRYWTLHVYPYSFAEYLDANGVTLGANWRYGRQQAAVVRMAEAYMAMGGFPELVGVADKRGWMNGIFQKIFFSDIVVRNGVRNDEALRLVVRKTAESVRQPTSYNRIANMVKSTGVQVNVPTVIDFVRYMRDSCLTFALENYASKFVEKETVKKHYFADNGLLAIFLMNQETALLENLCAIHLYRQYGDELYYYNRGVEVDFYVPGESLAVQACYDMGDAATREREIRALEEFNKFYPCRRNVIVAFDQRQTVTAPGGLTIEVVPLWHWLLSSV